MNYPSSTNNYQCEQALLLINSYQRYLKTDLICNSTPDKSPAQALFHAPFVVVSHNTAPDPIFNYANKQALELFGFTWDEFARLPSRLSAEPIYQKDRERLLMEVSQKGYLSHYQGIRKAKNSRRFMIKNAVVWNLIDANGNYAGQAARFDQWDYL